ncbi:hypothetical protein, partial [Sharpea azabuensis]|uniref:hypothetical protein n=1 Tax=Sharpea azabuensis TaxID=322505 RepID=UPI0023F07371
MDTDTSDMLIDKDAYRMAENLRYITDVNETTGELRLIEGAKEISIAFKDAAGNDEELPDGFKILSSCNIRGIGGLVCKRKPIGGKWYGDWAVYRAEYSQNNENNDSLILYRVFGWCEEPINRNIKISTTMKWEDEDQLQLYIADGKHPLMKINLYDQS